MEYLSGVYWRQGDDVTSLALKQLVYHKSGVPVLLGCMQSCGDGQVVEEIMKWFYEEGVYLCGQMRLDAERLEICLEREMDTIFNGRADLTLTVLLCVDDFFWMRNQGMQRGYWLNSRFGRPHFREVVSEDRRVFCGKLQKGGGILIGTEDFYKVLTEEQIKECLAIKDLCSNERVQKRMDELGRKACGLGGEHVGAMLAVTC